MMKYLSFFLLFLFQLCNAETVEQTEVSHDYSYMTKGIERLFIATAEKKVGLANYKYVTVDRVLGWLPAAPKARTFSLPELPDNQVYLVGVFEVVVPMPAELFEMCKIEHPNFMSSGMCKGSREFYGSCAGQAAYTFSSRNNGLTLLPTFVATSRFSNAYIQYIPADAKRIRTSSGKPASTAPATRMAVSGELCTPEINDLAEINNW